jgi:hypothetical protein
VEASIFISISTPAGRLKLESDSIVFGVLSVISINLLWVLISYWSLEFLCTKVDLLTVTFSILVGRGIGPLMIAPVLMAVSIISFALSSMIL